MAREARPQAMKDIARALARNGPEHDLRPLKSRKYADVPAATWWRWVKTVRDSGAPARKAAKRVKKHVAQRAKQADPAASITEAVAEQLPAVVKPEDVACTGVISAMDRIKECMDDANRVKEFCRTESGKIRNPKLYLVASRHILDSMKTAATISRQLMDAQRLEQFHRAILDEISELEPEMAERVLDRLDRLNLEWGAAV